MATVTETRHDQTEVHVPMSTDLHDQAAAHLREALGEGVSSAALISPEASDEFVATAHVEELTERALAYLGAGFPINLEGIPGTGKTTLALYLAEKIGRPVSMIHGDDQFTSADLIGSDRGYSKTKSIDNFVHSVLKTREETKKLWVDNRLTIAVTEGHTLIYDEFTRSRPEANNVLLSVLSEGLLNLPRRRHADEGYLRTHPEFRAIFTCNPLEYAGVHRGQDALLDRMIPVRMDDFDRETEVAITVAKSGIPAEDAERIVNIVRHFREHNGYTHRPSVRAAIVIAKVAVYRNARCDPDDPLFVRTCVDALGLEEPSSDPGVKRLSPKDVQEGIREAWSQS